MIVNVRCGEIKDGWIYGKFYKELKRYAKTLSNIYIVANKKNKYEYDIIHSIPYYDHNEALARGKISTAWFSHREEIRKDLKNKFNSAAKDVDVVFSHSKKYADIIETQNLNDNVHQIIPGVDKAFEAKVTKNDKYVVGYVGRSYISTNRKSTSFVHEIKKVCEKNNIVFQATGGDMDANQIPNFYATSNLIISPAEIEGGPMSLLESIKCGKPFLCFKGVGMADEFKDFPGVIAVKPGAKREFINTILDFDTAKYNTPDMIKTISSHKKIRTWDDFAKQHFDIWMEKYNEIR